MIFRRTPRLRDLIRVASASCLLALAACTVKKRDAGALRIALGSDPAVLDPALADTGVSIFALQDVVSQLLEYDDEGRLQPSDAESYEWTPDGLRLKLTIREGLTWSDDEPLRACAYRDGIARALEPATPSALAELLFDVKGGAAVKTGRLPASKLGLRCDDSRRSLEIDVETPRASRLLHALAFVVSAPVRLDRVAKHGTEWLLPHGAEPGVSSGAFVVESWARDRELVLKARPRSSLPATRRGTASKTVQKIIMPVVRDPATAVALYETGDLDVVLELPPILIPKLATRADLVRAPYHTTYMIGFSPRASPVLRDVRVRRALALAFNAGEVPGLLRGGEIEARGWIPPDLLPESARPTSTIHDPSQARKLMADAGFKDPARFPRLALAYNPGERHQLLVERAAAVWSETLGIEIELKPMEWKVLVAELKLRPAALFRYAWAAAYPDPLFFLEIFRSDSLNNFGGWKNAEYDRILVELVRVPLESRDAAFWRKVARAQEILTREDPAIVPIYHYVRNALVAPRVKGFRLSGRGVESLRDVRLE